MADKLIISAFDAMKTFATCAVYGPIIRAIVCVLFGVLIGRYLHSNGNRVIQPESFSDSLSPALPAATEEAKGNATSDVDCEELDPNMEGMLRVTFERQRGNNEPGLDIGEGDEGSAAEMPLMCNGADASVVNDTRDVGLNEEVLFETTDEPGEEIVEVNVATVDGALSRVAQAQDDDGKASRRALARAVVRTKAAEGRKLHDRYGMQTVKINGSKYLYSSKRPWKCFILSIAPRPLAEPPIFDFTWMVEEKGFIERQEEDHELLYEPDIKLKTDRIDLLIEQELLDVYSRWAAESRHAIKTHRHYRLKSEEDRERNDVFAKGLHGSIMRDLCEVKLELFDLERSAKRKGPHRWVKPAQQRRLDREQLVSNIKLWGGES